jgi:hypothetical protein
LQNPYKPNVKISFLVMAVLVAAFGLQNMGIISQDGVNFALTITLLPMIAYFIFLAWRSFKDGQKQSVWINGVLALLFAGALYVGIPRAARSAYLDYKTRTTLQLPFEGVWYVVWGGRTLEQNRNAVFKDRRFGYTFTVIAEDGSSLVAEGDGSRNSDYLCFGMPVLSPGDGEVIAIANDAPDNLPGEPNTQDFPGNYVVIDHGNGEYSMLAHLRLGSVGVEVGDSIVAGQKVGECGNSGYSGEPHLHYHLQNTPEWLSGEGLPAQFRDYFAEGGYVERGEPERGQRIEVK